MADRKYLNETGLQEVASNVNTRLKVLSVMPASANDGAVRLYSGATNENYIQGHIYKYSSSSAKWVDITDVTETYKTAKVDTYNGTTAKISGFAPIAGAESGETYILRERGGETIILSIGNNSQDKTSTYGYTAIRISSNISVRKIGNLKFDYTNRELYLTLGSYGYFNITQVAGNSIRNLTITTNVTVPEDDIVEIPITEIANKVDKVEGKGLSTEDYTTAEKTKLSGIAAGAEVNVQSDWEQATSTADDYIKNKPTLGTAAAKNYTSSVTSGSTELVTSGAVYTAIDSLPEPMLYKGTLGTGGTITTLPVAAASNEGFTYKVITAGTYLSITAKVGDVFISNGTAWTLIPSGDEPSGTVTNVATGAGLTGGPVTTSGTIKANLKSETVSTLAAIEKGTTADREYAVGLDKNGKLSVNIPYPETDTTVSTTSENPVQNKVITNNFVRQVYTSGTNLGFTTDQKVDLEELLTAIVDRYGQNKELDIQFIYSDAARIYLTKDNVNYELNGCHLSGNFHTGTTWVRSQLILTQPLYTYQISYIYYNSTTMSDWSITKLARITDVPSVDSTLDTSSTHAIQNAAVAKAIQLPYHKNLTVNSSTALTNKYVLIYEKTQAITYYTTPICLQGSVGAISDHAKTVFNIIIDFRISSTKPIIRGTISGEAHNRADIYATFDTSTNTARIYAYLNMGYSYIDVWSNIPFNSNTLSDAVAAVSGTNSTSMNTSTYVTNTFYDTKLETTSKNLIGAINELKNSTTTTVDDALSSTSTNPVQNKVVNSALNNKATHLLVNRGTFGYTLNQEVSLETFVNDVCNKYGNGKWYDITFIYSNDSEFYLVMNGFKLLMNGTTIQGMFKAAAWTKTLLLVTTLGNYIYEIDYETSSSATFTSTSVKRLITLEDLNSRSSNILILPSAGGSAKYHTITLNAISGSADTDLRGITVISYTGVMFQLNKNGTYRNLPNGANDNLSYITGISWESPTTLYLKMEGYRGVALISPTKFISYTTSGTAPSDVTFNAITKTGVDTTPTASSSNFVTSDGIKTALDNKNDKITVSASTAAFGDDSDIVSIGAGSNPTAASKRPASMLWTYIKSKISSVLGLSESSGTKTLDVTDAVIGGYRQKRLYTIDLSSLDTTKFYPVFFPSTDLELDCEIHSPNVSGGQPYNQNRIHFLYTSQGWADTPKTLEILSYSLYDINEVTIGAIGNGNMDGGKAVWVRGGLLYRFICNLVPSLKTTDYTYGGEIFTVGTNYWGGNNSNVAIRWSAKNFIGILHVLKPTFVVRDNETLRMWLDNDSGLDYSVVYITPGTYSAGTDTFKKVTASTKLVFGAGVNRSILRGVQLVGLEGGYDFTLKTGSLYNCSGIHDISIDLDHSMIKYASDGSTSTQYDFSDWSEEGNEHVIDSCSHCHDITIDYIYDTDNKSWLGMGLIRNSMYISNIRSRCFKNNTELDYSGVLSDWLNGGEAVCVIQNSRYLSNIQVTMVPRSLSYALIVNSSNISNVRINGVITDYACLVSCSLVNNCELLARNYETKNGAHKIATMKDCWNVTNCWIYAHYYGSTAEKQSYVGSNSYKIMNNYLEIDTQSSTPTNTCYATGTTNSSYVAADTPNGGFNYIVQN